MGKKFLVIVSLFVLFMFIDVNALTCNYPTDRNGISIKLTNNAGGWQVEIPGYTLGNVKLNSSQCPDNIYYSCNSANCNIAENYGSLLNLSGGPSGSISKSNQGSGSSGNGNSWGGLSGGTYDCQSVFGDLLDFLESYIFSPIRYLTPIVLVVLTSIDFAKAVFMDEKDGMKKAQGNFVKRAVAALLIFLAPTIVNILLSLLHNQSIKECLNSMIFLNFK